MLQNLGGCNKDSRNVQISEIYLLQNISLALGIAFSGDLVAVETKFPFLSQLGLQDFLYQVPVF